MTPGTSPAVAQLKQLIYYHLDNESLDNANFLAGRLHAVEPRNPDASHLLALTHLRLRRFKAAFDLSQKYGANGRHLGCAYVFALACQELGRYSEGISALEKAKATWNGRSYWNKHSETTRRHLPDSAAVCNLLAKLWRGHGDLRKAGDYYIEAHKANPFVWDAFQGLCDIGTQMEVANAFRITPEMTVTTAPTAAPHMAQNGHKDEPQMAGPPLTIQPNNNHQNVLTPSNDPFNTSFKSPSEWSLQAGASFFQSKIKAKNMFGHSSKHASQTSWETPTTNGNDTEDDTIMADPGTDSASVFGDVPAAPMRRSKTLGRFGLDSNKDPKLRPTTLRGQVKSTTDVSEMDDSASTITSKSTATGMHKRTLSGHSSVVASDASTAQPRRSNRLFSQITGSKTASRNPADIASLSLSKRDEELKKAKATGTRGRGTSTVGRVVSGNRKVMPPMAGDAKEPRAPSRNSVTAPSASLQKQAVETTVLADTTAVEALLASFRQLGIAYYALSRYDAHIAVEAFKALSVAQRETPWVQAQLGKAHYETADYAAAEACFARMLKLQPTRIEDTEVYSSVLWQLKKPIQLAFLAHTLRELDFGAPQTWCAVGNAFSLSREHEQAIACFKRATQLDNSFSYAWTLMGHELLTNEEFDQALAAYRKGVGGERRGYGGWYGLGKCYERMGKWEDAERHYQIAAGINPSNAVLVVCMGVVSTESNEPARD